MANFPASLWARLNPVNLLRQAQGVVKTFPGTVGVAFLLALHLTGMIYEWEWLQSFWASPELDENTEAWLGEAGRWSLYLALGLPLYVAAEFGAKRLPWGKLNRSAAHEIALGIHAALVIVAPGRDEIFTGAFLLWFFPTVLFTHLLVALVPFVFRKDRPQAFWFTNQALFLGFAQSAVFSFILYAGIAGILGALNALFDISLDEKVFLTVLAWVAIPVQTFIFLANAPDPYQSEESWPEPPRVLWNLLRFIVWPLMAIYAAILLAYGVKIILEGTLPRGVVTGLVGAFGSVGYLVVSLSRAYQPARSWSTWFQRILAVLLILLWVALGQRIADYGFTELRVLGFYLGFFLTVVTVYFLVRPNAGIRVVPAVLALLALSITVGPFKASSWAFRSQYARFERIAAANGFVKDGKILAVPMGADTAAVNEFLETAVYLAQYHTPALEGTPLEIIDVQDREVREWQARSEMATSLNELGYVQISTTTGEVAAEMTPQFQWESQQKSIDPSTYIRVQHYEAFNLWEENRAFAETGALWRTDFSMAGPKGNQTVNVQFPVPDWMKRQEWKLTRGYKERTGKEPVVLPTSRPDVFFVLTDIKISSSSSEPDSKEPIELDRLEGYLVQKKK
ncbi:MAG: DUF4153 domain-containing protein [Schleiferiaceae bacterium]|nr:DUF4153 domain-containing protein [Schleiferiaceae bacterium]